VAQVTESLAQGPEFKYQYCQKKKKKRERKNELKIGLGNTTPEDIPKGM
jgi:hypothetical protein